MPPSPQDLLAKVQATGISPTVNPLPTPQELLSHVQQQTPAQPFRTIPAPANLQLSSFGKNLRDTATSFISKAASKIGSFLGYQGQSVAGLATNQIHLTPDDVFTGIKQTMQGLGSGAVSLAAGINEGVSRIIKSSSIAAIGPQATEAIGSAGLFKGTPNEISLGALTKTITNKPSVPTYQDIYARANDYAVKNAATPQQAQTFAGMVVLGTLFADNPAFGPEAEGGKGLFTLSENAVKDLAGQTGEDVIRGILQKENPALTPTELDAITPIFRNASTPEEVKAAAGEISKIQQAPIAQAKLPTPDEIAQKAKVEVPPVATGDIPPMGAPASADEAFKRYYEEVIAPAAKQDQLIYIAGDEMKSHFGNDFVPTRSNLYSTAAYQATSKAIEDNPGKDLALLAGGPGSGKTELLAKNILDNGFNGILYDNSLSSYNGIKALIEKARANGSDVRIYGLVPDVMAARKFTLDRAVATGRGVLPEQFAGAHAGFTSTARRLLEDGIIKPSEMSLFDLRGVKNFEEAAKMVRQNLHAADPLALLKKVPYDANTLLARVKTFDYEHGKVGRIPPDSGVHGANDQAPRGNRPNTGAQNARGTGDVGRATSGVLQGSDRAGAKVEFSPNVVSAISKADMPGPIVDTLKKEFPHISDAALTPIAKRLVQLHRTADIEGVLKIVRNVNQDIEAARIAGAAPDFSKNSIAIVGDKKAVGDLPPSIGQLMTGAESGRYLDNISRVVRRKEDAVLAQQEYDALWAHADQRIIDLHEELKVQRDLMRDVVDNSRGKDLNALYKGTFLSPKDVPLDELINQRRGKEIDGKIDDIMGGAGSDIALAQKELEDFLHMRDMLSQLESDLRDVRPKARAARILQSMVEDVPVIEREHAGKIKALANPEDVRKYKDISGFMGQARDVYRNFEAVFGKSFADVKRVILDPFDRSKGAFADEIKGLGDRVEANVIKKYGIERGSKESAAIQLYGEGKISHEELIAKVGNDRVDAVMQSSRWFREEYDKMLTEVNAVRAKIYPNDPTKLIPHRKDYFRHFQEMSDGFRNLIDIFETPAGIDPKLSGLSEWTKPKSKFLSFAQERIGKDSTIDAVGGFLNYAPSFSYAKHIDPHIGNFRYLRRRLAESAPTPGVREVVPSANKEAAAMGATDLVKQPGINNFLSYLDDFANDLAGKTNPMDRYLQKVVPGGRKTFQVLNWTNSRVKANTILGNLSSAVAQIFNVPQGIASAKLYSFPGLQRTLASIFTENEPMLASDFIKERYHESLTSRFNIDWAAHPVRGTAERGKELAGWITQTFDELGTKFIWNAHYAKGVAESIADPVKYADDMTRKMVGGRGIGEVPLLQKAKVFQIVAPFQVEVANAWFVLKDFMKAKDFGAVATLLAANYLFNRVAQEIRGSPVVFDPIQSLIDGATQASDEMSNDGNAGRAAFKFVGRQVGEILSNVPLGQTIAAGVPDAWVQSATQTAVGAPITKAELFGSADPGRFGSGLLAINGIADPLYRLLPPFGGMQAKRTIEGISSMLQGQVRDSKGNLSFTTNPAPTNVVQAVLFGKNATQQAQQFYAQRDDLFNRVYAQTASRTQESIQAESVWSDVKKLPKDQAVAKMQALEQSDPLLADAVAKVAQDEANGLNGTDRLVGMLGVANGERAKYIVDAVKKLWNAQEKAAFLQHLDEKKLISDQVFQQIEVLMKQ